jgi:hypothetical protein
MPLEFTFLTGIDKEDEIRRPAFCVLAAPIAVGVFLGISSALYAQTPGGPDPFDPPDTRYSTGADDVDPATMAALPLAPQFRAFIPVSVDLSFRMPAPGDQGQAGSCVAWAVAYAARSYYTSSLEGRDLLLSENLPSPSYVYNRARQLQKKSGCEAGSSVPSAVEVLKKGALSLANQPYHASDCDPPAPASIVSTANDFRVRGLRVINLAKIDNVKGALAQSHPVIEPWRRPSCPRATSSK